MSEGVEEHDVDGVAVHMTNLERTVADCFKYRNKLGLEVALEALKEGLGREGGDRRLCIDSLWRYAKLDRVSNVIRPYLEALV